MTAGSVGLVVPAETHVAILAGGEGTRLWPLSRTRRPKQLLQLSGERTLIQQTVDRLRPLVDPERILIVTERSHADDLRAQLPELPDSSIVVEPTRRGTAAAVLLAALHVQERAPGATWASLHSDAFITDDDEFRRTLTAALEAAAATTAARRTDTIDSVEIERTLGRRLVGVLFGLLQKLVEFALQDLAMRLVLLE